MKKPTAVLLSTCVGLLVSASPGFPQTAPGDDPVPCRAVGPLLEEATRIASALEVQQTVRSSELELRKLEIAIAYLDLRMREIDRLERSLTRARDDRTVLTDALSQRATLLDQFEAEARDAVGDEAEEMKRMVTRAREAQEDLERRLADAERRVLDLENEIAAALRQIGALEDLVESNLTVLE